MRHYFLGWLPLLLFPALLSAQDGDARPPVTTTYFIDSAIVVTRPGETVNMGGIIIRDGMIEAVGKGLKAPADAKVIGADSLYVYAGFIDGLSYAGVPKPKPDENRPRVKRPGDPPNDVAGIQPERPVAEVLDATDKSITEMRQLGFTAAHVVPRGRMLPGQGALVLLAGDSGEEMILRPSTSLFAQFRGANRVYPATTMAIMAKFRELYRGAEQGQKRMTAYDTKPRGTARPVRDKVTEAFYPVLDKEQPVFFYVDGIKETHRALSLSRELGFPLALAGVGRGQLMADRLRAANVPLFLRLELPDAKDAKPVKTDNDKKDPNAETTATPGEESKMALEARRATAMEEFEAQAGALAKAGMTFGFSSGDVKAKDVRANLGRMIKAGLTEDQALAALTTAPAKMLGVSDVLGTVEQGKLANLVITDKPYFEEGSNVRYVFVEGAPTEYEVKKKKKKKPGDPTAVVKPAGTWAVEIDIPGQDGSGTLELTGEPDDLSGTLTVQGEPVSISDASVSGDNLTFSTKVDAGGQSLTLNFDLTITGDAFEGSVSVGAFGTFDVEGSRTSGPERQ